MDEDVLKLINKKPKNFCVLQVRPGFFGSLVYRTIVGSSNSFIWKPEFCGCQESLDPLEWPHLTEGFNIYSLSNDNTYNNFKENHLATAHISIKLVEYSSVVDVAKHFDINKILLLKTHDMINQDYFSCKVVRVVGSTHKIFNPKETTFRETRYEYFDSVEGFNIHNLIVENLMNDNFDIFLNEYTKLCYFLDLTPNVNNVRQFILLLKDKLKRYEITLS